MIPPDVASSLRLVLPDQQTNAANLQTQPVTPAQRINDLLSDLAPGQRILAEIQALLPNGTYRAIVAQRNVTLALPFSAKPGDTLELEVTESDGQLTLAFVADRNAASAKPTVQESVTTTLSPTGKLIGSLIGDGEHASQRAAPAPLNSSRPLVGTMPERGDELAPILKQALTQSGLFYEAHQARWVDGQLPIEALKQEPQGKLPFPASLPPATTEHANTDSATNSAVPAGTQGFPSGETRQAEGRQLQDIAPLVRQQLDGLATNNYAWQGQIWPDQQMHWEISENPERQSGRGEANEREWQSRLKLSLPSLGNVDATLRLHTGGQIALAVNADTPASQERLRDSAEQLQKQFAAAGLKIIQLSIDHAASE